eukprot:scaffold4155_cov165-Amphora_coffeaeformis.AAC.10
MPTRVERGVTPFSSPKTTTNQKSPTSIETNTALRVSTSPISSDAKYPTARGETTDSRKIIATGAGRQYLTAVRLSHILLASEELALSSLHQLRNGDVRLEELASQLSACVETRKKGGEIGWVSVREEEVDQSHLDDLLPIEARRQVIRITTKPGDVVMVESSRGYHLVQVADVMADVRKMATVKSRTRRLAKEGTGEVATLQSRKLRGVLSGALSSESKSDEVDLTYKVETMGCQMNMADSERIEGQLQSLGIRPLKDGEKAKADVVVLNTCSIRDHAEQKVYSYIGPYAKRKRDGEDVTIIVAGCVAQQEGAKLLRRAPEVDLVMGPQYANRIGDLLEDVSNGNQVVATEATHIMEDSTKPRRQSTVAAWVNVIYGCNERCTFCIVPTTRGVEQSRPVESIVDEVKDLVSKGYKEVTLLGQNIDAYGRDMIPKRKFSDLIRIVGSIDGLERLRFVTSHPRYMSLGVVDAVAETKSACERVDPPKCWLLWVGVTRARNIYTLWIAFRIPDASITADVIVGFPGETEEQFQETLSLMEEVVFDSVNTAAYSPRPNTPAAVWDNQVPDDVKQDRLQRINELNKQHAAQRRARMLGRTEQVLVEERNVKVPTQVMGRTRHGYIVYCEGDIDELRGNTIEVEIDTCQTYYLAGKRVV